jgi:hypothetical protein
MSKSAKPKRTGSNRFSDSSMVQLMFLRLNDSVAAAKMATVSALTSRDASYLHIQFDTVASDMNKIARSPQTNNSHPRMLGVKTGYETPGSRRIARITAVESAICGTHCGLTNDPASIARRPASATPETT